RRDSRGHDRRDRADIAALPRPRSVARAGPSRRSRPHRPLVRDRREDAARGRQAPDLRVAEVAEARHGSRVPSLPRAGVSEGGVAPRSRVSADHRPLQAASFEILEQATRRGAGLAGDAAALRQLLEGSLKTIEGVLSDLAALDDPVQPAAISGHVAVQLSEEVPNSVAGRIALPAHTLVEDLDAMLDLDPALELRFDRRRSDVLDARSLIHDRCRSRRAVEAPSDHRAAFSARDQQEIIPVRPGIDRADAELDGAVARRTRFLRERGRREAHRQQPKCITCTHALHDATICWPSVPRGPAIAILTRAAAESRRGPTPRAWPPLG